ncbi:large conductance mechanosensitive channel protein MscL [Lachnoclostridium phytofermentans]|uniref:Large-conductance mechanosensitive channel n=1 Tax=Lachnoclostridium phytofermentans (strain ATCC 700394 / DSM 18823 / ISDg) TaxID=357809 RepID=A9KIC1_LACP7|nr:large conductance mechanosensitive channel protein MscL [Lachnoclostridium phytofermentans]ABX42373.1 large conductance mechanosensitive channel protein [Lachnoclostridium phytofermentans ISDg]
MKKFLKEFREFALKGNVMNLAVGVIIGSAFQGIVTSLTDNILSPIIGLFTRQNFDSLQLNIFGITLRYGAFITALINFVIMAFVVFLLVKGMNRILSFDDKRKKVEVKPTEKDCPYCMTKININASRCPHCTSQLETIAINEEDIAR